MRVFLDTNIIYKLYRAYIANQWRLWFSSIKDSGYELVISTTIVAELETVCQRKKTLLPINHIPQFLSYMEIWIMSSWQIDHLYASYVYDQKDIHVVQDAVWSKSKAILTHNLKDFNIAVIEDKLGIKIIVHLHQLNS